MLLEAHRFRHALLAELGHHLVDQTGIDESTGITVKERGARQFDYIEGGQMRRLPAGKAHGEVNDGDAARRTINVNQDIFYAHAVSSRRWLAPATWPFS